MASMSPHEGVVDSMRFSTEDEIDPFAEASIVDHHHVEPDAEPEGAQSEPAAASDETPSAMQHQHQQNASEDTRFSRLIPSVTTPGKGGRPTLRDLKDVEEIKVIDAIKTSEGAATSYIAYVITSSRGTARHRYSEFESLRACLVALYPVLIVPPIPDKQSLGDYASHPASVSRTKEDPATVARRRRMLAVFLNRLVRHPILGRERILWRFLSEDVPWSEVLHQAPLTHLPRNPLKATSYDPANPALQALYTHMPIPTSSAAPLQDPDQRFLDSEVFTHKFSSHISGCLEKVNRRLMKRWGEYAADQAELGGVLNGFALIEGGLACDGTMMSQEAVEATSTAIERTGQAIDAAYMSTNAMLQDWERCFTEPLHEYAQFSTVIKQLLRFRHLKHVQYEMTRDILETKRLTLEDLEKNEQEAQRIGEALGRVRQLPQETSSQQQQQQDTSTSDPSDHVIGSSGPTLLPQQRRASAFGFLEALKHSLNGFTDADPEATRRSSIGKNKDAIYQLHEGLQNASEDLRYCSQTIQADLDRFQRQKVADIREMCLAVARLHIEAAKKNIEHWEAVKADVAKINCSEIY